MKTFRVRVTQIVDVTLDDTKFTPEFMAEFAGSISDFERIEQHAQHIGQLAGREVYSLNKHLPKEFVEGYGEIGAMGISAVVLEGAEEVEVNGEWERF